MIQRIVQMLKIDEHYGVSDFVDIAKGKYKLNTSLKKAYKQGKRELINKRNGRG